ncbi:3-hydroxyacyl-CoA dehydrogenase [Rhodococcus sp. 06-412-2C]|uniref:3-hydroxyacyl-CoA dehydrogenase NAD-binding domain-containing protein n=1 Tax=unclassified Rhodococcus (in: high G+C Gram-positive bacteria) TaxID=192944 RepID=UPI000B9AA582|nr:MULTISPECIES: 3-hydroxyacyl-CoA dehydrogenase NAD-binding domain-containing protein [unclassified Rhodococcus (in: high G+C Gram-positive bacteria)]OZC83974.1 3-hydroxyacyl-CoA dehydrogenase [Rhodococcus sp. 06-412-2C]OZC94161.1 3-hydroxyacyl-CoA dehydrogenase [Rhodococcus sp. 06-412-2B]
MTVTVAIVGTGVIGSAWAACFLAAGHDVVATDPADGAEARLTRSVEDMLEIASELSGRPASARGSLRFVDTAADAVRDADFVQESGPERLEDKRTLLADIDCVARPGVIVASSTSGFAPSRLQELCRVDPGRVLVGHPFNPAHIVPLVEVVPGQATTREQANAAMSFYRRIGKKPILVRAEIPGHVTNRLQAALWREAYSLVDRGVATVADIDTAISNGPGLRWAVAGPLITQHLSGGAGGMRHLLEHLGPPTQKWMDDLGEPQLTSELADKLVAGIDHEMADVDQAGLVADRDRLLVDIMRLKRSTTHLP